MSRSHDQGLPIEQFIQALTSQLDRVQSAMALKARAGLPLTFAVKDMTLELRAHVDMRGSTVLIRPAGPGEGDASLLNLQLTTITRPMIEENTLETVADPEELSIEEVLGDQISAEEQRRLEWAGIQTVSQLVDVHRRSGDHAIGRVSNLPVNRLRAALARASRPQVSRIAPAVPVARGTAPPRLSIRGRNLIADRTPRVRIDGHDAEVVEARNNELVVAPISPRLSGVLEIETEPGSVTTTSFDLVAEDGMAQDGVSRDSVSQDGVSQNSVSQDRAQDGSATATEPVGASVESAEVVVG